MDNSNLEVNSENRRRSNNSTAMAGEFFVMERLYRLGHEPALTLGNAKKIDIIVKLSNESFKAISVKSVCGGGKWSVGSDDWSKAGDVIFVFLLYKKFEDISIDPDVWIMPAKDVERGKSEWFQKSAIYYTKNHAPDNLSNYRNAWNFIS